MSCQAAGFLVSPHAAQAITTSWAVMALTLVTNEFTNPSAPGGSTYLGDLELDLDTVAGGATALMAMLTYDVAGHFAIAGPTAATAFANLSGALGTLALSVDQQKVWPTRTGITPGTVYLWLKTNAGTCNVSASGGRLQWRDIPS